MSSSVFSFLINEETEINIAYFEIYPQKSIQDLSRETHISVVTIHRIKKKRKHILQGD